MSLKHIQLEQMCSKGDGYQDQNSSNPHLELDLQALLNTQQKTCFPPCVVSCWKYNNCNYNFTTINKSVLPNIFSISIFLPRGCPLITSTKQRGF